MCYRFGGLYLGGLYMEGLIFGILRYSGFDLFGRIVLIRREILVTTGMAWPVSSDKWKAP